MYMGDKMSFFNIIFINIIILTFPIAVSLILEAYFYNFNKEQKNIIYDIACISSSYLIIKYNFVFNYPYIILLSSIPLIVCFYNKRLVASIIICIINITIYYIKLDISLPLLITEHITYLYMFYVVLNKKDFHLILTIFTLIKGIILFIYSYKQELLSLRNIIKLSYMLVIFIVIGELLYVLLKKGKSAISINTAINNLEKEKNLKTSLFKITHEVKNPLAVCNGYLSMMDYSDMKKVEKYNNIIKKEIERTLDILDNFSKYTKINITKEPMDISLLIKDIEESLNNLLISKSITFINKTEEKELYINGDYNRLKQVLINILKNSIESIDEDGKITIELKETKNKINIIITDNGIGMDKETLEKLGQIFNTTKENGTGIGVALSKEIIKLHDGNIKYESELHKGTKVCINLPKM